MDLLRYFVDNWPTLGPQIVTHIEIVAVSMAAAALIGLFLGVVAARSERFSSLILSVTSIILTVPSFALFGLLSIWVGLGNPPVVIGLVLYALLPVVRNTSAGIRAVDPAVTEAARGMGMNPDPAAGRVELPLAAPVILGGIRQATVMVVAIATVGATVGVDDLGQGILEALGRSGGTLVQILAGVLPVAMIGLVADGVLAVTQRPSPAVPGGGDGVITFDRVSKRYGRVTAVGELSLNVASGEIVVLAGPSGCGKTTSLTMINRLVEPTSGTISIDGRDTAGLDVDALRRSIGYVIQQVGLSPSDGRREHRHRAAAGRLDGRASRPGSRSCWSWWACRRPDTPGASPPS